MQAGEEVKCLNSVTGVSENTKIEEMPNRSFLLKL